MQDTCRTPLFINNLLNYIHNSLLALIDYRDASKDV